MYTLEGRTHAAAPAERLRGCEACNGLRVRYAQHEPSQGARLPRTHAICIMRRGAAELVSPIARFSRPSRHRGACFEVGKSVSVHLPARSPAGPLYVCSFLLWNIAFNTVFLTLSLPPSLSLTLSLPLSLPLPPSLSHKGSRALNTSPRTQSPMQE